MIELDGSKGSGGGQILRTAIALSIYTGKPFFIENIRKNRPNPGLAKQHLKAVEAAKELSNAKIEGRKLKSTELTFKPFKPKKRDLNIDIETAGSITLLLQALILPGTINGLKIEVKGGTDVKWSPTWDYFTKVTKPLLKNAGVNISTKLERRGHYPEGGGKAKVKIEKTSLRNFTLKKRGKLHSIRGLSHVSNLPGHIAERQADTAQKSLIKGLEEKTDIEIDIQQAPARSRGTGITLWANFEKTVLGGSSLGERGKRAEKVGKESAKKLLNEIEKKGATDRYMGDQLVPFAATAGNTTYTTTEKTEHLKTNIETCKKFLNKKIELKGKKTVQIET